jgi:phage tail sheath protein FI
LGLGVVDEITVIALPDLATACTGIGSDTIDLDAWKRAELTAIAEAERDQRMVILDPPPGMTPQQVRSWRTDVAGYDSRHAVLYYPWVLVDDPLTGRSITVPPCGHVAGVWASVERERGVWFAPANRTLVGVARGERRLTRGERFFLEPVGINPMRGLQERDVRPWGSRTMSSDPSWSRVEVVRTVFAIARGCERGLEWAAFEPNTTATRSFVRRRVEAFLRRLWHDGALVGGEPSEAFVVQCDEQVSPPDAPVRVLVGVAPHTAGDLLWFSVGGSG